MSSTGVPAISAAVIGPFHRNFAKGEERLPSVPARAPTNPATSSVSQLGRLQRFDLQRLSVDRWCLNYLIPSSDEFAEHVAPTGTDHPRHSTRRRAHLAA